MEIPMMFSVALQSIKNGQTLSTVNFGNQYFLATCKICEGTGF